MEYSGYPTPPWSTRRGLNSRVCFNLPTYDFISPKNLGMWKAFGKNDSPFFLGEDRKPFYRSLPPCKLTCPLKIDGWKVKFPFAKWFLCRVDIHSFSGGICWPFWIGCFSARIFCGFALADSSTMSLGLIALARRFVTCGNSGTWYVYSKENKGGCSSHQSIGLWWYNIMEIYYDNDSMKISWRYDDTRTMILWYSWW